MSCLREVQTISKSPHILPMPSLTRLTTGGVLNPLKNTTKIGHNKLLHQEPLQPPLEPSKTGVGRARRPTPHSSQEPGRRRGSPVQLSDLSAVDPLLKEREDDVSLTGLIEADRATHVQPDTVLPCGDRDVVGSHAPRQAVTDLPYVN